ncbi:uncharacterized protein LOC130783248 [Actinidia eriantha]|uniref:uncharacterized protein LOC130783243 n=1 Tax=Actinidia eriantha TaxID=165200 RepID=UPI00258E4E71|nr:uncharacterized protein LOC130783243 [Actinidia eriantha]XP_057498791.1 uncharacterized protein LOC130783248 [Actinidia eriantha]
MASLPCSARPSPSILGFRRPSCRPSATTALAFGANVPFTPLNFRFKNAVTLQLSRSSFAVFASSSNPSDQDPLKEKSDEIKTGDASQGPPFLTILAGLLVFLVVCWIIGSILSWLIGLIFHSPPTK